VRPRHFNEVKCGSVVRFFKTRNPTVRYAASEPDVMPVKRRGIGKEDPARARQSSRERLEEDLKPYAGRVT
jgi:hypothetical protein